MAIREIPEGGMEIDPTTGMPYDPETGEYAEDRQISSSPDDRRPPAEQLSIEEEVNRRVQEAIAKQQAAAAAAEPVKRGPGRPRKEPPAETKPAAEDGQGHLDAQAEEERKVEAARVAAEREAAIQRRVDEATARGAGAARSAPEAAVPLSQQAAASRASVPAQARSTALAEPSGDLLSLYLQDAAKGLDFGVEDMAIPRLYLLQDMSPQVKDRDPDFVPGARPGMWLNTVTRQAFPSFRFIPIKYQRRFVGWRPRAANGTGGGLVRMDVPREEFFGYEEIGIGVRGYNDEKGAVEVVETPEWVGYMPDFSMSAAVSFPKTKAAAASNLNTLLTLQKVTHQGQEVELPCYASVVSVGSKVTGEGQNSYFVPNIVLDGRVEVALYHKMRKLHDNFSRGDMEIVGDMQR
jgi:hypothetical protein